jgi:regulator of sigma E protease
MSFLYTILSFSVVLGIIVLVHEFGHYFAARLTGVRVETFSFGFGKRIFGKKIGDTDFRVSLIPLGGYVKMAGEEEYDPDNLKPDEFHAKNRGQKIFILAMGSIMNLLLAFFLFTAINITGVELALYKSKTPVIEYVVKGSPAEKAGIRPGDLILSVDGDRVANWRDLENNIGTSPGSEVVVEYVRSGNTYSTTMNVDAIAGGGYGYAGLHSHFCTSVGSITKDSPADKAGLKVDDVIMGINNQPYHYYEFKQKISGSAGKELLLDVKRGQGDDTQTFKLSITPQNVYYLHSSPFKSFKEVRNKTKELRKTYPELKLQIEPIDWNYQIISKYLDSPQEAEKYLGEFTLGEKGIIGIGMGLYSETVNKKFGLFAAMKKSTGDIVKLTTLVFKTFRKMIVGKLSPDSLSGPIEIAKFSQRAFESGLTDFFVLIAFISLQLGLVNLFPIPALDGGHLMIFSIEAIIRKDFSPRVKGILMNIGFALLIALMVFVILNDVRKTLPNGWSSLLPF